MQWKQDDSCFNQFWNCKKYGLIFQKFPQVISVHSNLKHRFLDKRRVPKSNTMFLDKKSVLSTLFTRFFALLLFYRMRVKWGDRSYCKLFISAALQLINHNLQYMWKLRFMQQTKNWKLQTNHWPCMIIL